MAEVVPLKCLLQLYYTAQNEPLIMSRWSLLSVKAHCAASGGHALHEFFTSCVHLQAWTSCLLAAGVLASQAQVSGPNSHAPTVST